MERDFAFNIKQELIVRTTGTTAIHIFMVGICFDIMWLVLAWVCCDSIILVYTPKIMVPASPYAEIRMCIGTHVYYVPRMVCEPKVIIRSNSFTFVCFLESMSLVL